MIFKVLKRSITEEQLNLVIERLTNVATMPSDSDCAIVF